jgi:hypothetical protein
MQSVIDCVADKDRNTGSYPVSRRYAVPDDGQIQTINGERQ